MNIQKFTAERFTPQQLQNIYDEAVAAECASKAGAEMADFALLCKADEAGGIAYVVRKLIDMARAVPELKTTVFIDGDLSSADAEKIAAAIRNWDREVAPDPLIVYPPLTDSKPLSDQNGPLAGVIAELNSLISFFSIGKNEQIIDRIRAAILGLENLQEYQQEVPGGLFELQNIKSDARAVSTRLADALTRNSQQAIRIGIYERIYGPLRECPGEDSIYPAGQHTHGRKTFYCLSGHHHIGEYMFGPDEMASHTHSVTGGENDTDR